MCLLNERLAAEHQDVVEYAHSEHGDARLLDEHGAGAQQQTDEQTTQRHRGRQRVLGDTHTHAPETDRGRGATMVHLERPISLVTDMIVML